MQTEVCCHLRLCSLPTAIYLEVLTTNASASMGIAMLSGIGASTGLSSGTGMSTGTGADPGADSGA